MKKLISMAIAAIVVLTQFSIPVMSAITPRQYGTDFETEESYNWMTISNTDTVGEATTDWAEIVTKAYGTDTDNKALVLRTGANAYTEYGLVDTGHQGTEFVDNPVIGNIVISLDFMIDSAGWTPFESNNETRMLAARMTDGTTVQVARLIKNSSGYAQIFTPLNTRVSGAIYPDTWSRLVIDFNPTTGKADYILTTNVDNSSAATVKLEGCQIMTAGACNGINRVSMNMYRPNLKIFFDNLNVFNYEATTVVSTTPENGAEGIMPMEPISIKFNNEITNLNLSIGGTPIPASDWTESTGNVFTYKPFTPLAWNTPYTISGTVTDFLGKTANVSLQFRTGVQPEKLIEVVGFYKDENADTALTEDERLSAIESGTITAKLRFWQTQETSYTYIMGFYRDNGGVPEMVDIAADTVTSAEVSVDKSLQLTVPAEYSDCYIRLFFLNNMSDRLVLGDSITVGDTILR